jgi:hypothetical protein
VSTRGRPAPLNQNPSVRRAIGVAWGGVLYYYRAEPSGFALLLAELLALALVALRGASGLRLATLVVAFTLGHSAAMFRYAFHAILRLWSERGLRVDAHLGMTLAGAAETLLLVLGAALAGAVLANL